MKKPLVTLIITTYNQDKLLEETIKSLKKKTNYKNYKIILVDDGSKKKIGEIFKKRFRDIDVIINKVNKGFSGANNIGMKYSLQKYFPDYFLLLNDDMEIIDKKSLDKLTIIGESNNKIGILGGQILYTDRTLQNIGNNIEGWKINRVTKFKKNSVFNVDSVMGCCFLIKKSVVERIGFLDEIYNPYLLEETDYCLRAKKEGFFVKCVSSVKIIHKKGKTIDSLNSSKKMFIRFKNDLIFSMRHLTWKNALFRIFVYLPIVAIFKKRKDTDDLKFKNFILRKDFMINLGLLFLAHIYNMKNVGKIYGN